jgi:hypothetical protein
MNMTSRLTLVAAVGGLILTGCSSPADDPGPPTAPPPLANPQFGAAGTGGGTGGTTATPAQGGTGGAPASAAGAGGSAVAPVAGSGGMTAAAGAGGAPTGIGTGTGNLIIHDSTGWVAGTTNAVGIQGSFYSYGDFTQTPMPGDTTVTVDPFAAATGTVCISGTASAVIGEDYGRYWGGGIALNLADPGGMGETGPWTRGPVTGFSFTVTGPTIPPNIRFNANATGGTDAYCVNDIPTAGVTQIQLGTLLEACYNTPPGAALAPTATLQSIQWQVVTVVDDPTPFDFCIENLTALTTP